MNVLLSSASNKVPLLRALRDAVKRVSPEGIVTAGDSNENVLTRYFCDEFWRMPHTVEANTKEIIGALKQRKITHVLPTRDGELLFWAQIKETLKAENISVIVSEYESIERCLDKLQFAQLNLPSIIPAFDKLDVDLSRNKTQRLVVKERFGAGSKSIGINLSANDAVAHASSLSSPIYQPCIEGSEISVDAWLTRDGRVKAAMCRVRELVINGESQVTYTLPQSPLLPTIQETLEALNLSGPVVLQAIVCNEKLHIIECNSRFGGASTLGIKAGVDSLYWSLCETLGHDIDAIPVELSKEKITLVRAATDYYL